MRFAYATTSVALATGVVLRALHQRANFYSACVYLAQSNACLMVHGHCILSFPTSLIIKQILTNLALLCVCTLVLGLQRVFYGPLRAIEVEQLYEKAWFAITETCLAMTIFREEVGGWFLVMFVALLIGKVWGWIGEGRVEILEQQPPQNPRFFHARLSFSLILSLLFDIEMLHYSIQTVLLQARPNMMVMFAFEFAVLFVTTMSTAARYYLSLHEAAVVKMQTSSRRAQLRQERANVRSSADTRENTAPLTEPPRNDSPDGDIDSMDIDVPGWEEKGRWVFYLDLMTGTSFHRFISKSTSLILRFRLPQTCPVFDIFLCLVCVLRHANPHHSRRGAHHPFLLQAGPRLRTVPESNSRHERKISGRNSRRGS